MGVKLGLRLRKEHRLGLQRKISGPKIDKVREECRRLHNEELLLSSLPNFIWVHGCFTFCTCKILICLVCFVASFKLSFV